MEKLKSPTTIAAVTTALLIISMFWLMRTKHVNNSLKAGLQEQKLASETLLSEKLLLQKDIEKMKDQLFSLKGQNLELDHLLNSATSQLKSQESEFIRMKKENASIGVIKKQREELISLREQLENDLRTLKTSYVDLEARNHELHNVVVSLQERNRVIMDDLNKTYATLDQSQILTLRGNREKLTVKAGRTRKLVAKFEVPSNLKNLTFRISDSEGNRLLDKNGSIVSTSTPSDKNLTVSTDSEVTGNEVQNVEMIYSPKDKLKSGVYTVEILNENLYVGSLKVKLR